MQKSRSHPSKIVKLDAQQYISVVVRSLLDYFCDNSIMSRGIRTLWDNKDKDEDKDEEPRGQAFYAGGSEHSGQQILGPTAGRSSSDPIIQNIFNQAARIQNTQESSETPASTTSVVFWRNGFTVGDDNQPRDYAAPGNREFLDYLRRGEIPPELSRQVRGGIVDIKLENKLSEDHKPEKTFKAFAGAGHRLGGPC